MGWINLARSVRVVDWRFLPGERYSRLHPVSDRESAEGSELLRRMFDPASLPWASPWQRRCRARGGDGTDYGRCDLRRGHKGHHALERGMYVVRFGTSTIRYESG